MRQPMQRVLEHSGLRFTAVEMGEGPLVLLLHGFPDTRATFAAQLPALAAAGYRAVAVTLRGYEPSSQPADADYHVCRLAEDVIAHVGALGERQAHLVGHDWGASIAYAAAARSAGTFHSLTALAVPHPAKFAQGLAADAAQMERIGYITHLVTRERAAVEILDDNCAWLRALWARWSPGWRASAEDWATARQAMTAPGVADSAVAYYRQALDATSPAGLASLALYGAPIAVPTLALCGREDGCIGSDYFCRVMTPDGFTAGLEVEVVEGAGHFLHREQPDRVNARLLRFMGTHRTTRQPHG